MEKLPKADTLNNVQFYLLVDQHGGELEPEENRFLADCFPATNMSAEERERLERMARRCGLVQ